MGKQDTPGKQSTNQGTMETSKTEGKQEMITGTGGQKTLQHKIPLGNRLRS